jgi:hypothetical protein
MIAFLPREEFIFVVEYVSHSGLLNSGDQLLRSSKWSEEEPHCSPVSQVRYNSLRLL